MKRKIIMLVTKYKKRRKVIYVPEPYIMYSTSYGAVDFLIVPYKGLYGWRGRGGASM
jgi:hypothetical protein